MAASTRSDRPTPTRRSGAPTSRRPAATSCKRERTALLRAARGAAARPRRARARDVPARPVQREASSSSAAPSSSRSRRASSEIDALLDGTARARARRRRRASASAARRCSSAPASARAAVGRSAPSAAEPRHGRSGRVPDDDAARAAARRSQPGQEYCLECGARLSATAPRRGRQRGRALRAGAAAAGARGASSRSSAPRSRSRRRGERRRDGDRRSIDGRLGGFATAPHDVDRRRDAAASARSGVADVADRARTAGRSCSPRCRRRTGGAAPRERARAARSEGLAARSACSTRRATRASTPATGSSSAGVYAERGRGDERPRASRAARRTHARSSGSVVRHDRAVDARRRGDSRSRLCNNVRKGATLARQRPALQPHFPPQ